MFPVKIPYSNLNRLSHNNSINYGSRDHIINTFGIAAMSVASLIIISSSLSILTSPRSLFNAEIRH